MSESPSFPESIVPGQFSKTEEDKVEEGSAGVLLGGIVMKHTIDKFKHPKEEGLEGFGK